MTYAVFSRANGTRFAYVDRFGSKPTVIEMPSDYRSDNESPATYLNRNPAAGDFVDVVPYIAQELADAGGAVYDNVTVF